MASSQHCSGFAPHGVTSVVVWKTSDIASQRAKLTTTVRDVLGGHSIGAWKVEYAVYDQAEVAATRVQQRHRKKARTVASAGSRSPFLQSVVFAGEKPFFLARHTALLQADATLGPSLEFAGTATQRTSGIIEGVRFALGDFTVCIGACKMKGTYRALVVEVCYGPCVSIESGRSIISDFLFSLGQPESQVIMPMSKGGGKSAIPPGHFSRAHVALQYIHAFEMM